MSAFQVTYRITETSIDQTFELFHEDITEAFQAGRLDFPCGMDGAPAELVNLLRS